MGSLLLLITSWYVPFILFYHASTHWRLISTRNSRRPTLTLTIGGAIASVASIPMTFCTGGQFFVLCFYTADARPLDVLLRLACKSSLALVAFAWINAAIRT